MCGWCDHAGRNGYSSEITERFFDQWSARRFLDSQGVTRSFTACFVQPNATCHVCQAKVYFYSNKYGSRVFFDELGWPWPKHSCTDRRTIKSRAPAIEFVAPVVRARGSRTEIVDATRKATFSPLKEFVRSYGRRPPALLKVVAVVRKGFLNFLEVVAISPEADGRLFIEFTSAKITPEINEFVSFQDGRVSVLDSSSEPRNFQARIVDSERIEIVLATLVG